jgi:hypothetical protein
LCKNRRERERQLFTKGEAIHKIIQKIQNHRIHKKKTIIKKYKIFKKNTKIKNTKNKK